VTLKVTGPAGTDAGAAVQPVSLTVTSTVPPAGPVVAGVDPATDPLPPAATPPVPDESEPQATSVPAPANVARTATSVLSVAFLIELLLL
jgi:hypothetical protein